MVRWCNFDVEDNKTRKNENGDFPAHQFDFLKNFMVLVLFVIRSRRPANKVDSNVNALLSMLAIAGRKGVPHLGKWLRPQTKLLRVLHEKRATRRLMHTVNCCRCELQACLDKGKVNVFVAFGAEGGIHDGRVHRSEGGNDGVGTYVSEQRRPKS